jgi:hypothetical protein
MTQHNHEHDSLDSFAEIDRQTKQTARFPAAPDDEALHAGYEVSDVSMQGITRFGIGLLLFMAISLAIVTGFQSLLLGGSLPDTAPPAGGVADPPATPVPQNVARRAFSGQEARELREGGEAMLSHYQWVNQEAGIVRIPIDHAIDLLIQRGLPSRPADAPGADPDQAATMPLDSSSGQTSELIYEATPTR